MLGNLCRRNRVAYLVSDNCRRAGAVRIVMSREMSIIAHANLCNAAIAC